MTHLFKSHSQSINSGVNLKQRPLPKGVIDHMALDAFYLKMAWPRIEEALGSMDAVDRTAIMNASIKRAEVCDETYHITRLDKNTTDLTTSRPHDLTPGSIHPLYVGGCTPCCVRHSQRMGPYFAR